MIKLYFIGGASGSGKSAIMADLQTLLGNEIKVYDFDDIGVPDGADKKWRQESTEKWLNKLLTDDKDACLLGQIVLGEILACPSAAKIDKVNFCLLDVSDFERIQRLKKRNTYGADQNMLNWSAWLRMHHQDPQWTPHVIKNAAWDGLDFSALAQLDDWTSKANVELLDTTDLSIESTSEKVAAWTKSLTATPEIIPDTSYTLHSDTKNAFEIVDERLFEYNKQCVPATQKPEVMDKHFIIKDDDKIIAGIYADIYIWKILYVSVIFVDEKCRNKGIGSILLNKVEEEAKTLGVKLAHLDTFDFQAKDFYEKHGYEVFGVLDDCPEGHKRYYMRKYL